MLSLALVVCGVLAPRAGAAPAWQLTSVAFPSNPKSGDGSADKYLLSFANVGADIGSGAVTITDTLPNGVVTREPVCSAGAGESVVVCAFRVNFVPFEVGPGIPGEAAVEVPVK